LTTKVTKTYETTKNAKGAKVRTQTNIVGHYVVEERERNGRRRGSGDAVECAEHGLQGKTYVCQHILVTLHDRQPRGFCFDEASKAAYPDAWCEACNTMTKENGGQWTDELEQVAQIKLICAGCYLEAKRLNGL
jgi:hypothetical protein